MDVGEKIEGERHRYSYLFQATMHLLALKNESLPPTDRKRMINNYLDLLDEILSGSSDIKFELNEEERKDDVAANKAFVKTICNRVLEGLDIQNEQTQQQIIDECYNRADMLMFMLTGADHGNQVLEYVFDKHDRKFKDGFIGKENFFQSTF